ncbi:MAG: hypothetical protein AAFU77_10400 [Myxococcota bacterium]
MAGSAVFRWLCEELEKRTQLNRLQARGAVRLLLRDAGLEARSLNPVQASALVRKRLRPALERQGVSDAGAVRDGITSDLSKKSFPVVPESAEDIFSRLGRSD